MKQMVLITLILIINFILVACSDGSESQRQSQVKKSIVIPVTMTDPVKITANASSTKGRILVNGKTNLPNQTELLVSLANEAVGFSAEDKSKVMNGKFSAGPFGPTKGLGAGNYSIEIIMPIPRVQPVSVQKIIGIDGEHLSGPSVENSSLGKTVEYSFHYKIGEEKSIAKTKSDHTKLVSEVRETVNKLLKAGRSMETLRNTDNLSALRTCGKKMRQYQQEANLISKKAESLALKYISLKASTYEISLCVSCKNDALESCGRTEDLLLGKL